MTLSYSAVAGPASVSTERASFENVFPPLPTASATFLPTQSSSRTGINHLVLDAGPLLSLTPLRHLASILHTSPLVIAELRDPRAREHWERLGLTGVEVKVEMPSAEAMARVIAFAKKTGDYAVLSQTDLSVLALTYQYEVAANGEENIRHTPGEKSVRNQIRDIHAASSEKGAEREGGEHWGGESVSSDEAVDTEQLRKRQASSEQVLDHPAEHDILEAGSGEVVIESIIPSQDRHPRSQASNDGARGDTSAPVDDSDGEGNWITPSNVKSHRSHDLGLLSRDGAANGPDSSMTSACLTGDFAVQNVLLGMGLGLVGEGGKRISKVKSWVLRCHACFKICKDSSKRFCPSCGNPTLLRTTVTTSAKTGQQSIHLKKNFQYHLRGTIFPIPDAKPGRAKGQQKGGSGLILREDQAEWQGAVKAEERRREKEDRRMARGATQGWNDPDWLPEIITVGVSGKGRARGQGMPTIGHGRKNPNQARRKR